MERANELCPSQTEPPRAGSGTGEKTSPEPPPPRRGQTGWKSLHKYCINVQKWNICPGPVFRFWTEIRAWSESDNFYNRRIMIHPINIKLCNISGTPGPIPDCRAPVIYMVSQEEWTQLRESVPHVELYRYNPKHLYTKLNGYGDNGQRSLKLWQLLHTYYYQIHIKTGRNMWFL